MSESPEVISTATAGSAATATAGSSSAATGTVGSSSSATDTASGLAVPLFAGTFGPRDLLAVLQLLHKAKSTGLMRCDGTVDGRTVKAQIHFRQGNIRTAFYEELLGPAALTRALMMGAGTFALEAVVEQPARNVSHETAFLLDSIGKVLAERDRRQAEAEAEIGSLTPAGGSPTIASGPATERIVAFHPPQVGDKIGKCRLKQEIGQGASSVVFLAHHESLDVDVVVKVLIQDGPRSHHRALTVNEAQLLARLNHPNIVRLYDFDETSRHPHLIVEYIDGPGLTTLLQNKGRLDADEGLPIFCQVAEALAYADATLGLIHCDLKPDNILLTTANQAKLADFGVAKGRTRQSQVPSDMVVGSPSYIAPEQVRGGHSVVDRRSDIYALGATFYHVFTGRPPFIDEDPIRLMLKRLDEDPRPAHELVPTLDRRISDLLQLMLARDPERRLDSYDELIETLMATLEARDRKETSATVGNIIRRRTTFWRSVPTRLFGA